MNKKGQVFEMDDPATWVGIIGALIGAGIGILVTKSMEGGLVLRLMSALVCAVVCFFIAQKITDG